MRVAPCALTGVCCLLVVWGLLLSVVCWLLCRCVVRCVLFCWCLGVFRCGCVFVVVVVVVVVMC